MFIFATLLYTVYKRCIERATTVEAVGGLKDSLGNRNHPIEFLIRNMGLYSELYWILFTKGA